MGALIPAVILAMLALAAFAQDGALMQGVKGDKPNYQLEETVEITYAVHNQGTNPLVYTFPTSKKFDVWITRGSKEVWRLSRGKSYAQMFTNLTVQPGQTVSYDVKWNQRDNDGNQVGPGTYTINAQLTPQSNPPAVTKNTIELGTGSAALVPVTVRECVTRSTELVNRRVTITGIYRGWQPDPNDPNCKDGPPVSRSDWAIADYSGCMYVTGQVSLDPRRDIGAKITVIGKVQKTLKGQVYLVLESATVEKGV